MKRANVFFGSVALAVLLIAGLGCKALTDAVEKASKTDNTNTATTNAANSSKSDNSAPNTNAPPAKVEKADFTMTSEALDKEFTRSGVTSDDLEKYSNKNIAVTGRVTMLVTETHGKTPPWVTLYAPGVGNGVNCYFDDHNVIQMKSIKEDKIIKIQGFQDDFIVPQVSPMLKHCVVLEGAN